MKIALIAPTYLPARRANTIQVMKMAQAFTALQQEVRVLAPTASGSHAGLPIPWEQLADHYGLQHRFAVEWLPARAWARRYDYGLSAVRRARSWGAHLVYTRLPQAAAIASGWGMATIFEIHDLPQGTLAPWLLARFLRGSGGRALVVITAALSEALAQRFGALTGQRTARPFRVLVAPDGVDLARYERLPSPEEARQALFPAFQLPLSAFVAGYTGHLYPGRGADLILDLAAQLPDVIFLLAGGEPADVARLQAEAGSRRLGNVILTGFIPNAELPRYQAACDLLLMPYQRQVAASSGGDIARYLSPMKLFEYLACGRAILSGDLPVLREVLNESNARLLPPDDLAAWVAAIRDLRAHPEQRAALAAQARRAARQYSWEARAARILEVVERSASNDGNDA
jgi:glycosyltransferase involved in cell wall biosynthesis